MTHDTRDHPPPQHISSDSVASPRPSSRRRSRRGGRSQLAASFQVLPPTMWAGARVVTISGKCAADVCGGSVLAITWTWALISLFSCRVNCCRRPVFKKNLVLTSQLTAIVLQPSQTPPPANSIFYNIDIGDLPTPMFQQAPMSLIFDVRCVHRPNSRHGHCEQ